MKKIFLAFIISIFLSTPSIALIEVDITRGNLRPSTNCCFTITC